MSGASSLEETTRLEGQQVFKTQRTIIPNVFRYGHNGYLEQYDVYESLVYMKIILGTLVLCNTRSYFIPN